MPQIILDTTADARQNGLEQFLEFWLGPRRPEYGEPSETLAATELPDPLRRFYGFAGRWPPRRLPYFPNRFSAQDILLVPGAAPHGNVYRSGDYLVFAIENQGVWVAATLPMGNDPDVVISEDCSHRTPSPVWRFLSKPLSHFLVTLILHETMLGSEQMACGEKALAVFESAGCKIEPLWLNGEYAWPDVRVSFYLIDDRILLCRGIGDVAADDQWYGFNAPECIDFLKAHHLPTTVG